MIIIFWSVHCLYHPISKPHISTCRLWSRLEAQPGSCHRRGCNLHIESMEGFLGQFKDNHGFFVFWPPNTAGAGFMQFVPPILGSWTLMHLKSSVGGSSPHNTTKIKTLFWETSTPHVLPSLIYLEPHTCWLWLALEHEFPVKGTDFFVPPCLIYSAIMWNVAAHDQPPIMLQTCRRIVARSLQTVSNDCIPLSTNKRMISIDITWSCHCSLWLWGASILNIEISDSSRCCWINVD